MTTETKLEYFPDANTNSKILSEIPNRGIKILSRNLYQIGTDSPSYIYSVGENHATSDYSDVIIKDINNIIHKLNLDISNINIEIISEVTPIRDIKENILPFLPMEQSMLKSLMSRWVEETLQVEGLTVPTVPQFTIPRFYDGDTFPL